MRQLAAGTKTFPHRFAKDAIRFEAHLTQSRIRTRLPEREAIAILQCSYERIRNHSVAKAAGATPRCRTCSCEPEVSRQRRASESPDSVVHYSQFASNGSLRQTDTLRQAPIIGRTEVFALARNTQAPVPIAQQASVVTHLYDTSNGQVQKVPLRPIERLP